MATTSLSGKINQRAPQPALPLESPAVSSDKNPRSKSRRTSAPSNNSTPAAASQVQEQSDQSEEVLPIAIALSSETPTAALAEPSTPSVTTTSSTSNTAFSTTSSTAMEEAPAAASSTVTAGPVLSDDNQDYQHDPCYLCTVDNSEILTIGEKTIAKIEKLPY